MLAFLSDILLDKFINRVDLLLLVAILDALVYSCGVARLSPALTFTAFTILRTILAIIG